MSKFYIQAAMISCIDTAWALTGEGRVLQNMNQNSKSYSLWFKACLINLLVSVISAGELHAVLENDT